MSIILGEKEIQQGHVIRFRMTSKEMILHETVTLDLPRELHRMRFLVEVWSSSVAPDNFRGCTSFGLRKLITNCEVIQGSYYLFNKSIGSRKRLAVNSECLHGNHSRKSVEFRSCEEGKHNRQKSVSLHSRKLLEQKEFEVTAKSLTKEVTFGPDQNSPPCIESVVSGSEAEYSGLRKRDVVLSINQSLVSFVTNLDFKNRIRSCQGTFVLKIMRADKRRIREEIVQRYEVKSSRRRLGSQILDVFPRLDSKADHKSMHRTKFSSPTISGSNQGNHGDAIPRKKRKISSVPSTELTSLSVQVDYKQELRSSPLCEPSIRYAENFQKSVNMVRKQTYYHNRTSEMRLGDGINTGAMRSLSKTEQSSPSGEVVLFKPLDDALENACCTTDLKDLKLQRTKSMTKDLPGYSKSKTAWPEQQDNEINIATLDSNSVKDIKTPAKLIETATGNLGKQKKIDSENIRKLFRVKSKRIKPAAKSAVSSEKISDAASSVKPLPNGLLGILKDKDKCAMFRNFLSSEHSEENLDFWLNCESYKSKKPSKQRRLANSIHQKYTRSDAEFEVNINSKIRSDIEKNISNPSSKLFQEAQDHIFRLMESDSFRRYQSNSKTQNEVH